MGIVRDVETGTIPLLKITNQFSGDNYQIEGSLDSGFSCSPDCSKSGILTAWKRGYAEYVRMYKSGEFLAADATNSGNRTTITLRTGGGATFQKDDRVHIFSAFNLTGEKAVVIANPTATTIKVQRDADNDGQGDGAPLSGVYYDTGTGDPCTAIYPYSFVARLSRFPTGENPFFELDTATPPGSVLESKLPTAFSDTYSEWTIVQGNFIPTWTDIEACAGTIDEAQTNFVDARTHFFFSNYDFLTNKPFTNHVQLVAAGQWETGIPEDVYQGRTKALNNFPPGTIAKNWTWILAGRIKSLWPSSFSAVLENVTAHELGHQWNINLPGSTEDNQYSCMGGPTDHCLMNPERTYTRGVVRFHCNLNTSDLDLYCIRGHADDLNLDDCTWTP